MAGDWIKMRVWISRDPRVIGMADYLAAEPRFVNPVGVGAVSTVNDARRNVTVALCVTGLLVTWGTAREQGDRENDDLVVTHCKLSTLDAMTGLPFFGLAMASVGWATEREDGALVFPKFFKDNESPDDRHKRQNAERQARFRDSHRNEEVTDTSNVTVTHREEKRRVTTQRDKKIDAPTEEHVDIARTLGHDCALEWAKYLDQQANAKNVHSNRVSGFRNWLRRAHEFKPPPLRAYPGGVTGKPTIHDKRAATAAAMYGATNDRPQPTDITGDSERIA